jgi:hypothetical protein
VLCLLTGWAFVPGQAHATFGPKWWGDRTAEPPGLKAIAITRESLTVDMRPLVDLQPIRVEAVYELSNSGPAATFELLFIFAAPGAQELEVLVGDRMLECRTMDKKDQERYWKELPKTWRPPDYSLGLDGEQFCLFFHQRDAPAPMLFSLKLPPGASVLKARFTARASGTPENQPTATWMFPYVLAPAKEWGSFGRLEVKALLPEGWEARSSPDLKREGDTLVGSFQGVPADILQLATRAPVPEEFRRAQRLAWPMFGLTFVAVSVGCWLVARWTGRLLRRWLATAPAHGARWCLGVITVSCVLTYLWVVALGTVTNLLREWLFAPLGDQANPELLWRFAPGLMVMVLLNVVGLCAIFAIVYRTLGSVINKTGPWGR